MQPQSRSTPGTICRKVIDKVSIKCASTHVRRGVGIRCHNLIREESHRFTQPDAEVFPDHRVVARAQWKRFLTIFGISALVLVIHGFHYGIEDEGIYLPAVKQLLNRTLYAHDSSFFLAQARL